MTEGAPIVTEDPDNGDRRQKSYRQRLKTVLEIQRTMTIKKIIYIYIYICTKIHKIQQRKKLREAIDIFLQNKKNLNGYDSSISKNT
ncbi:hypothetical protein GDO78_016559 [Eleutherodactylus coqui]|uniref:Uncharacterized protein n=1 Tax=Eleutherodactylus coqui TaxID=57060 RepID=A0A8J6EAI2_ELECQ|nr:hypothetical protein GDO78_016559 [Eleutherodactylus coqui]